MVDRCTMVYSDLARVRRSSPVDESNETGLKDEVINELEIERIPERQN